VILNSSRCVRPAIALVIAAFYASGGFLAAFEEVLFPAFSQSLPEVADLVAHGVRVDRVAYRGRPAIRLLESNANREGGLAVVSGLRFQDGRIEVDVAGVRGPHAIADDRGFVGVAFRVSDAGVRYENIYIRPDNGRVDDQVRRNHVTQYTAHPDFPFSRMRKEWPERYESYADVEYGAWTRLRVDVAGTTARLFVHDAPQPALVVTDLKLGVGTGGVALWIGAGTEGYFSNLRIR